MAVTQDYAALAAHWPSVQGADLTAQLETINNTVVTPAIGDEPAIYWPQGNGWNGPLNQNDLVTAGAITEKTRQDYDATLPGYAAPLDGSVRAVLLDNALNGIIDPLINVMDAATVVVPDLPVAVTVATSLISKNNKVSSS